MKTVFKNYQELSEAFICQEQDIGRTPENRMSFKGNVMYSYSTPVAKITRFRGRTVLLITKNKYSNTTSKQIGALVRVCVDDWKIMYSYDLETPCLYDNDIIARMKKLSNARTYKKGHSNILQSLLSVARYEKLLTESKFPLFFDKKHEKIKQMLFSNDEEVIALGIKLAKKQELL